jgi:hypothetical protein
MPSNWHAQVVSPSESKHRDHCDKQFIIREQTDARKQDAVAGGGAMLYTLSKPSCAAYFLGYTAHIFGHNLRWYW